MGPFLCAHATHPQWRMAAELVLAQLRAAMAQQPLSTPATLGVLYVTEAFAPVARELLDTLSAALPLVTDWVGSSGVAIAASDVEYVQEPALVVMLCKLPVNSYRVFSGVAPLGQHRQFDPQLALVHADARTPDLVELVDELAQRMHSGQVFGGMPSGPSAVQFAVSGDGHLAGHGGAAGVFTGGLSGVAFDRRVVLTTRLAQGCRPLSRRRRVTESQGHVVVQLDGRPALDVLLDDLGLDLSDKAAAVAGIRATHVGLTARRRPETRSVAAQALDPDSVGADLTVRPILGVDPAARTLVVADAVPQGRQLQFVRRDAAAARADLVRVCAEIRDEVDVHEEAAVTGWQEFRQARRRSPGKILGAVYISCLDRGGAFFGAPSAEMQIVRHALGDVPVAGFFAQGEVAYRNVYSQSAVLMVFMDRRS